MCRIAVVVQRDLMNELAGFLLMLDSGGRREPIEGVGSLNEAMERSKTLMGAYGARSVQIDDGEDYGTRS